MKIILTEESRGKIESMISKLDSAIQANAAQSTAIHAKLAQKFGEEYRIEDSHEPTEASMYKHICGNTMMGLSNCAGALKRMVAMMRQGESAPMPQERQHEIIGESLQMIASWKTSLSNDRIDERETNPKAVDRSIKAMEKFVQDHKSDFGADEFKALQTDIKALKTSVRDVAKQTEEAKRLAKIIIPKGRSRDE